jgi:hypothetical protein
LATEPPDEVFAIAPDEVTLALLADAERGDAPHAAQANRTHASSATPLVRLEDRGPAPTARVWQTIVVALAEHDHVVPELLPPQPSFAREQAVSGRGCGLRHLGARRLRDDLCGI